MCRRRAPVHRRTRSDRATDLGSGQCPTCGIACRHPGGGSRALGSERVTAGCRGDPHAEAPATGRGRGPGQLAHGCGSGDRSTADRHRPLRDAVTVEGITEHLAALEDIANANLFEGCRRGRPARRVTRPRLTTSSTRWRRRVSTSLQPFGADIFFEQGPPRSSGCRPIRIYPRYDGENGVWYTAEFSGDGDVTAEAVAVDFTEPTTQASASSSGCEAEDFGPDGLGKIVLLQRGTCDFGLKAEIAAARRAVGGGDLQRGHHRRRGSQRRADPDARRVRRRRSRWSAPTTRPVATWWTDRRAGDRHAARRGRRLHRPGSA